MSHYSLPGPGDQCFCGTYYGCRCPPEPDPEVAYDEAYERGYDACTADGYDNHPLACWPSSGAEATMAHDWVTLTTGGAVTGVDGRRFYGSHWFNVPGGWRLWGRYARDPFRGEPRPEGFLAGFDDAACGLPSAVRDPVGHALCAAALDGCRPLPDLHDEPLGPWPAPGPVEDEMPF